MQTLGERAVAGAWLVAWAIMAMGAIIKNFFNKTFMPISARGTTVAQANSECTLITIRMYLSVI